MMNLPEQCFEQANVALSVTDTEGNIVAVNAAYEAMFGYRREELIGRHVSITMPETEWAWTNEVRRRLMAGELDVFRSTKRYATKQSFQRLDVTVSALTDDAGECQGLLAIYDYALDRQLIDDDAYLRNMLSASPAALMTVSRDGVIASTSGRYQDALGYPPEFWQNRSLFDLVADEDRPRAVEYLATVVESSEPVDCEISVVAADGTQRVVLMSATNLLEDPAVAAVVLTFQDISEVHQRIAALVEQRRLAETIAANRADLLAMVSHELRNPLHALQGMAELLAASELPGDLTEIARELHMQISGLAGVTADLLDASRAERGQLVLHPSSYRVTDMLNSGLQYGRAAVATKSVEVTTHIEPNTPAAVLIDRNRVDQIVRNLVGNAAKFTTSGTINLTIGPIEHGLHITVSDTGSGIPQSEIEKILQPFVRGSNSEDLSGAGLGLAIVHDLAEAMGGDVIVSSKVGRGSTFRVELNAPKALAAPATEANAELRQFGLTVLVVDDDRTNRLIATRQLERLGCDVVEASSGEQVIELLRDTDLVVDAILMDRRMPGLDGIETTALIRQLPDRSDVYIIGLSASASEQERFECAAATMDGFVAKPASVHDLNSAIAAFVDGDHADQPSHAPSSEQSDTADEPDDDADELVSQPSAPASEGLAQPPRGEPVVDRDRLDTLTSEFGDADLVADLVASFVGDLPQQCDELRDAHTRGDHVTVKRVAHTIKGSAAMLGARRLETIARELEAQPSLDVAEFSTVVDQTCDELGRGLLGANAAGGDGP